MTKAQDRTVAVLLKRYGRTYAQEAGITVKDAPAPLYQLLVLSTLLSARISASVAVAAAHELFAAGFRTPQAMSAASWQQRVDALGRGHYRRYDERTATMLGDGAELLTAKYRGDLRRLHSAAEGTPGLIKGLQEFPGIGPVGAAIFCREIQAVWTDLAPFLDQKVADGATRLGLPAAAAGLAGLVGVDELPRLAAACVRAALDDGVVADVQAAAAQRR
ncbi:endonuclease [Paenarthrobacter sp. PH39-S1]|uniref:endonuclease n=1 Tax=Paenarthrobacter sp. PH39-S1 TaxID=3046204 RepID=UPI0024B921F6|nr:endonuclease [Paenarthrobacter sp. PH39-S1]MDJ0355335.1 endonuclease [Paenarthrobacter sp. PH39-S1]